MIKRHPEILLALGILAAIILLRPHPAHNLPGGDGATKSKSGDDKPWSATDIGNLATSLGSVFKGFTGNKAGDNSSASNSDDASAIHAPQLL